MISADSEVGIALEHAARIESIRRRFGHCTSSHAFNTLYIWRRFVGGSLHLEEDLFSLRYKAKGENTWLFPCGDREAAFRFISGHLEEPDFSLCYLREADVRWLTERFPGRFRVEETPGDSEYVVSRAGHEALSGKRYEKLRGKVKHAERDYGIVTERLNEDNTEAALRIIHAGRGNRHAEGSLKMYGDEEDTEPLLKQKELGITGILMRVNGEPFGVAAGFMLNEDTCDLFLAKECVKDPYLGYYMRREWMRMLPENVKWVNLEDDLEIEGLRTMKKQMIPEKMNTMWMAVHDEQGAST